MEDTESQINEPLTFEESRVLGSLIEKESTTPDYYPMTLNALVTACNQSTSREPVVSFDERTVSRAIEGLKAQKLAFQVSMAGSRVPKFKHNISGRYPHLEEPGIALLCTLLLRGPQTVGELRQRSERMVPFPDIPSVESELNNLINHPGGPLITFFAPGGGRKSATYAHLLCGEVSAPNAIIAITASEVPSDPSWKEKIEAELASLRADVAELKALLS